MEEGIALYEIYYAGEDAALTDQSQKLVELIPDPNERRIYVKVAKELGGLWAAGKTGEELSEKARRAVAKRNSDLTKEQLAEISRKGGLAKAAKIRKEWACEGIDK